MNIDNYTDDEIIKELNEAKANHAYYETRDKRLKSVKRELLWYNAIIKRDEFELKRRGVVYA